MRLPTSASECRSDAALSAAYDAGRQASIDSDGVPGRIPNPHPADSAPAQAWNIGWNLHWDPVWKFGEGGDKAPRANHPDARTGELAGHG